MSTTGDTLDTVCRHYLSNPGRGQTLGEILGEAIVCVVVCGHLSDAVEANPSVDEHFEPLYNRLSSRRESVKDICRYSGIRTYEICKILTVESHRLLENRWFVGMLARLTPGDVVSVRRWVIDLSQRLDWRPPDSITPSTHHCT